MKLFKFLIIFLPYMFTTRIVLFIQVFEVFWFFFPLFSYWNKRFLEERGHLFNLYSIFRKEEIPKVSIKKVEDILWGNLSYIIAGIFKNKFYLKIERIPPFTPHMQPKFMSFYNRSILLLLFLWNIHIVITNYWVIYSGSPEF
jgi:hypothetical protein